MPSEAAAGLRAGAWRPLRYRLRLAPWAVSWLQVSPMAIILVVLFAAPTLLFFVISFFDYDRVGMYPAFLMDNYRDLLTTPATLRIYVSSLKFACIVWAITLFVGFNIAHFLVFHVRSSTTRMVLFLLCAIPFWTSGIIRTIAWIPFLGRNGVFNTILIDLHLVDHPLDVLLFSDLSVVITYVHLYTLLMIGPIANSLSKIDRALLEAAVDAGASRWQVMRHVILPLAKTGIVLGSILVFTQVMGDYFVVKQMSGGQSASIVSALSTEIQAMQYPPASASAVTPGGVRRPAGRVHDAGGGRAQGIGELDGGCAGAPALYVLPAGRADGPVPAVSVWPDGGDLRAVVPGAEWWRHLPDGRVGFNPTGSPTSSSPGRWRTSPCRSAAPSCWRWWSAR